MKSKCSDPKIISEVVTTYLAGFVQVREIARITGINKTTVHRILLKQKLKLASRGSYERTDIIKDKISEGRKGICVGKDNPQFGRPRTEAEKRKISKTIRAQFRNGRTSWNKGGK